MVYIPRTMKTFLYLISVLCVSLSHGFAQSIVFSEIHYNPADGSDPAGLLVSGDEYEFLELHNAGPVDIDLLGAAMVEGISYTFTESTVVPAGGYLLLVTNRERFAERYPSVTGLAPGTYGGRLSNSGETLTLVDGLGEVLYSVTYKDSGGWPRRADGLGSSLVLLDLAGDPDDPANWSDSAVFHGQPGEPAQAAWTDVVLNEILAHSDLPEEDAIELKNLAPEPIDLSGWYLSDNPRYPTKYRITSGSPLPGGGYRVFYEYQFNANPPVDPDNIPFAISSFGEPVLLLAPHPLGLRLVDAVKVPATPNGISFGRYPDGEGSFTLLEVLTFGMTSYSTLAQFRLGQGAANSVPMVGTVVINEIMYHPATEPEEDFEYIELFNRGAEAVDLSGWVMRGVGLFTFPLGTTLDAGAYLVLASNPTALIAKYDLDPALVVGPFIGSLRNSGELLRLTNDNGAIIDYVEYNDVEPWPVAADGLGPSLERLTSGGRGDTSSNWQSSMATTDWVQLTWTQTVSGNSHDLRIWADYNGLIWLDDVSVRKVGDPTELVLNGEFEDGEAGWTALGNHARSRAEAGQGRAGTRGYGIGASFTRIIAPPTAYIYQGDPVDSHIRSEAIATEDGQEYVISLWLRRGSLGGTINVRFADVTRTMDFGHEGAPGAANTRTLPEPGPRIKNVTHAKDIVATEEENLVVADISGNPDLVELRYRVVGTNTYTFTAMDYQSVPMVAIGDDLYSGTLPGMTGNGAVLYHVRARNSALDYEVLSPRLDDPSRDWGYRVESNPIQTTLPDWQIYADGGPIVYPHALYACAVSPDGQVFPHAIVRHRGRTSSSDVNARRTGLALRTNKGSDYDAFFAPGQGGINFRHREDAYIAQHNRTVNEYLAYHLQRALGLVTPHTRHICLWIDGEPTITVELESPQTGFLDHHGLAPADYISRAGYTGRNRVDGNEALDNFNAMVWQLENVTGPDTAALVHSNLWLETLLLTTALNNIMSNGDQHARWNMFQHRRADNGLWTLYAWDTDIAFQGSTPMANGDTLLHMHPYYQTPDHGNMWNDEAAYPVTPTLFYPETGPGSLYTLSYRHRHQMNLWRLSQTLFTPEYLYPLLDQLVADVGPAFTEISVLPGHDGPGLFLTQVNNVKGFIADRHDWLYAGDWSDKDPDIWNAGRTYDPTAVVVSEIMIDPPAGPRYIELFNPTPESMDASWWRLDVGANSHRLPHGTLIAPFSYLVIAAAQIPLSLYYSELSDPAEMVQRNVGLPLWDHAFDALSRSEHRTRVVEIPALTLPLLGTTLSLHDWEGRVVCQVPYLSGPGWPDTSGASLELVTGQDPALASSWRRSFNIGTPGGANTADDDVDGDGLPDSWEQLLVDHFDHLHDIFDVLPENDEFGDGLTNWKKYVLNLDPTVAGAALLHIDRRDSAVEIRYPTAAPGDGFINRFYTLEWTPNLTDPAAWSIVESHRDQIGTGLPNIYIRDTPENGAIFRLRVNAQPARMAEWEALTEPVP